MTIARTLMLASLLLLSACSREERGALRLVSAPAAEQAAFLDPDGVIGRRFADQVRQHGWVLAAAELTADETRALDRWRAIGGSDLVLGGEGDGEHALYLGPGEGGVLVRAHGALALEAPLLGLAEESRPWLDRTDRIRWEEVVEFADLLPEENLAIRNLTSDSPFLGELKQAFLRDKRVANLALYLSGTRAPRVLLFRLDLPRAQAELARRLPEMLSSRELLPAGLPRDREGRPSIAALDPELRESAAGRRFLARLLASDRRVAGRCDRVYQSLAADAPPNAWIVVDARDSETPFVAVLRSGRDLGPAEGRGPLLRDALTRDQWR